MGGNEFGERVDDLGFCILCLGFWIGVYKWYWVVEGCRGEVRLGL